MSLEQIIAANTAAVEAQTTAILKLTDLFGASAGALNGKTTTHAEKDTSDKGGSKTDESGSTTIYWHLPSTGEFGTVESEAEFKKLKKEKAKAVKIPESKYQDLVEAASKTDGEYSDRLQALLDAIPDEPEEGDIVTLFQKYLSKDLEREERDARAALIKPILAKFKAAKATAVKEEDRHDVMVDVTVAIETHLEETGQVSDDEENGLV